MEHEVKMYLSEECNFHQLPHVLTTNHFQQFNLNQNVLPVCKALAGFRMPEDMTSKYARAPQLEQLLTGIC